MPELPEVETTVRGLERVLKGRRIARIEARRADLRRALPDDLGQRLTGAHGHRASAARQIWPDRHRSRRQLDLPPRHVGAMADRPDGDRKARPFPDRDRRRPTARAQRSAAVRFARPGRDRRASTNGRRSPRSGPSRSISTPRELQAAARRAARRRSSCCCSTSGSSPASAISMSARRCSGPASIRKRAGGSVSRPGSNGWCRRSTRCSRKRLRRADRRLRDFASPDGELGYFSKRFDVYGREGEPCRGGCGGTVRRIRPGRPLDLLLPALPALSGRLTSAPSRVGERRVGAAFWLGAVFH